MRFLIVSGPTREPIDPVRYLSNYSTGTMGKHLNDAAKKRGHRVDWVRCPENAETARDLLKELKRRLPKNDVLIMAAAVCDRRPASFSAQKIKKDELSTLRLVKNPDILHELSKIKKKKQIFIGFALESRNILKNGFEKLSRKGLELIVVQKVMRNHTPFGDKPIEAYVVDACGCVEHLRKVSKKALAMLLVWAGESLSRQQIA